MPYRFIHPEKKHLITLMSMRMSVSQIANSTDISQRAIRRTLKTFRDTGDVVHRDEPKGRRRTLSSLELLYLEGLIEKDPDMYLSELRASLGMVFGVDVDETTISRSLSRRGYTRKVVSRIGRERDELLRAEYQLMVGTHYPPETLVFLDESACDRRTARRKMAWAPKGDRARRHDFFVRGTRYSILPAISLDGILHLDILTRSWTGVEFRKYVEALLRNMNPFPQRNSVLLMDNASTHHFEGLRELVEAHGMRLQYLPPYSPDFNPIEEGFSAMKAWIRRNQAFALVELSRGPEPDAMAMLWEAVCSVMTPGSIAGWYRDCGYYVPQ